MRWWKKLFFRNSQMDGCAGNCGTLELSGEYFQEKRLCCAYWVGPDAAVDAGWGRIRIPAGKYKELSRKPLIVVFTDREEKQELGYLLNSSIYLLGSPGRVPDGSRKTGEGPGILWAEMRPLEAGGVILDAATKSPIAIYRGDGAGAAAALMSILRSGVCGNCLPV